MYSDSVQKTVIETEKSFTEITLVTAVNINTTQHR